MNPSTVSSNLSANWVSSRQVRLYAAKIQGRDGLLPDSTWKRWKRQLGLSSSDRLFDPQQTRLVLEFAAWLREGGSVKAFLLNNNIQQKASTDEPQQQQQQRQGIRTESATTRPASAESYTITI